MKNFKKIIKNYYKKKNSFKDFDKEIELLENNSELLNIITKIKTSRLNNKVLSSLIDSNNYKINKTSLIYFGKNKNKSYKSILKDANLVFIKKLAKIINYENNKINELTNIKSIIKDIDSNRDFSINKYYQINEYTECYIIVFLFKIIDSSKNKYRLLRVLELTLNYLKKDIEDIFKENYLLMIKNIEIINNILNSIISINELSPTSLKRITTYKREYITYSSPSNINLLSNKRYTMIFENNGKVTSKYNNINLNFYDEVFIKDIDSNRIMSIRDFDSNSKYKYIFNNAISKYTRSYNDFTISSEFTVSQVDDLSCQKLSFKNNDNKKNFYLIIKIPINKSGIKHLRKIKSIMTYNENLKSFIVYRFININNYSFKINNNYIEISSKINLNKGIKKEFYILTEILKNKDEVFIMHKKYNSIYSINNIFFVSNVIKNNIDYRIFSEYNDLLNLICNNRYYLDNKRRKLLINNNLNIRNLWKYNISFNRRIILGRINNDYNIRCIDEIIRFYIYLLNNNIYIDLVFLYDGDSKYLKSFEKDVNKIEKYYNYLTKFKSNSNNIFTINSNVLNKEEESLFILISEIALDINSNSSLGDIISKVLKENKNKLVITDYENSLKKDMEIIKENNTVFDVFSSDEIDNTFNDNMNVIKKENSTYIFDDYNYIVKSKDDKFSNILTNNYLSSLVYKNYTLIYTKNYIVTSSKNNELLINNQKVSFYTSTAGFGYSIFTGVINDLDVSLTKTIANTDNIHFFKIDIKNNSNHFKEVNIKYLLTPLLDLYENDNNYFISEYDYMHNIVTIKNKINNLGMFITSTVNFKNVYLEEYFQKVMEVEFFLEKDKEKSLSFMIGTIDNNLTTDSLYLLKERYSSISVIDNNLSIIKYDWKSMLNTIDIKTKDENFNHIMKWSIYNILVNNTTDVIYYKNLLDEVLNLVLIFPNISKEKLLVCIKHTLLNGNILYSWNRFQNIGKITNNIDEVLYLLYSIKKYIEVTEDTDILFEQTSYLIAKKINSEDIYYKYSKYTDSIYSHLEKVINNIIENRSNFNIILLHSTISIFIDITKYYNKNTDTKKYRELLNNLNSDISSIKNDENVLYKILFDMNLDYKDSDITVLKDDILLKVIALIKTKNINEAYTYYKRLNPLNNKHSNSRLSADGIYFMVGLELFLGFRKQGKKIFIKPNLPNYFSNYEITYNYLNTIYYIKIEKSNSKNAIIVDSEETSYIPLKNDYRKHYVEIYFK